MNTRSASVTLSLDMPLAVLKRCAGQPEPLTLREMQSVFIFFPGGPPQTPGLASLEVVSFSMEIASSGARLEA